MTNIDNMLKKVLGKSKSKRNNLGLNINSILGKPLIKNNLFKGRKKHLPRLDIPIRSILGKSVSGKRTSMTNQLKWSQFSSYKKFQLSKRLKDSDNDKVPDKYDCQPFNSKKQDTPEITFYQEWLKEAGKLKNKIEKLGFKVMSVGIRSIGTIKDGKEFINELYECFNNSSPPIDIYATIPPTSNLGKTMKKQKIDPNKWWIRFDKTEFDKGENLSIELLPGNSTDYQSGGYSELIINDSAEHNINIVNDPNIILVPIEDLYE